MKRKCFTVKEALAIHAISSISKHIVKDTANGESVITINMPSTTGSPVGFPMFLGTDLVQSFHNVGDITTERLQIFSKPVYRPEHRLYNADQNIPMTATEKTSITQSQLSAHLMLSSQKEMLVPLKDDQQLAYVPRALDSGTFYNGTSRSA